MFLCHCLFLIESTRQPSKRRKRKGSAAAAEGGSNNSGGSNTGRASKRKQSPVPLPSHHMAQPGVSVIGFLFIHSTVVFSNANTVHVVSRI